MHGSDKLHDKDLEHLTEKNLVWEIEGNPELWILMYAYVLLVFLWWGLEWLVMAYSEKTVFEYEVLLRQGQGEDGDQIKRQGLHMGTVFSIFKRWSSFGYDVIWLGDMISWHHFDMHGEKETENGVKKRQGCQS